MITIYGELYSSKNSKRIVRVRTRFGRVRRRVIKSKVSMRATPSLRLQLNANRRLWEKELAGVYGDTVKYPIHVMFTIYRKTHARFDFNNIAQQLIDEMVKAGYVKDDRALFFVPHYDEYKVDGKSPRTCISILNPERRSEWYSHSSSSL